jgi:hypothetical protein
MGRPAVQGTLGVMASACPKLSQLKLGQLQNWNNCPHLSATRRGLLAPPVRRCGSGCWTAAQLITDAFRLQGEVS